MHNMTGLLGAAVGVAIAAVIWAVVVSLRKKRSGDAPEFDERQLAAHDRSQQLADAVGVSRQTIVAIEKGDYNPTIRLCISICQALGCTLDALFWPEADS